MTIAINKQVMVDLLMRTSGATPITIIAETEPKMKKTGNPFAGRIRKVARINGMVNFQYDAGVLRRLEKEGKSAGDFERGESWHQPVKVDGKLTPLCEHKTNGKQYLRFMVVNTLSVEYQDDKGNVIDKSFLEPWLSPVSAYANQGLDNPLVFVVYGLDTIRALTMNNETYVVT